MHYQEEREHNAWYIFTAFFISKWQWKNSTTLEWNYAKGPRNESKAPTGMTNKINLNLAMLIKSIDGGSYQTANSRISRGSTSDNARV